MLGKVQDGESQGLRKVWVQAGLSSIIGYVGYMLTRCASFGKVCKPRVRDQTVGKDLLPTPNLQRNCPPCKIHVSTTNSPNTILRSALQKSFTFGRASINLIRKKMPV